MIEKYIKLLNDERLKNDKGRKKFTPEYEQEYALVMYKPDPNGYATILTSLIDGKSYTDRRGVIHEFYKKRNIQCNWSRDFTYDDMYIEDWIEQRKLDGFITYQELWTLKKAQQEANPPKVRIDKPLSEKAIKAFKKTLVKRKSIKDEN